jgi:hypothetical protein
MADYGYWNFLPAWDRALADWLSPVKPYAALLLVATALLILYASWRWRNHPELQLLALAFIWSP